MTHLLSGVLTGFFGNVIDGHDVTGAQDGFAVNGNSLGPHNFVQTLFRHLDSNLYTVAWFCAILNHLCC